MCLWECKSIRAIHSQQEWGEVVVVVVLGGKGRDGRSQKWLVCREKRRGES